MWKSGVAYIAYLPMRHYLGQAAHIAHKHGPVEMIAYLCDPALGSMFVWLYHYIRRTEIVPHHIIGYEPRTQYYLPAYT